MYSGTYCKHYKKEAKSLVNISDWIKQLAIELFEFILFS